MKQPIPAAARSAPTASPRNPAFGRLLAFTSLGLVLGLAGSGLRTRSSRPPWPNCIGGSPAATPAPNWSWEGAK